MKTEYLTKTGFESFNCIIPYSVLMVLHSLVSAFSISQIILFGSRAHNDHESTSDIDLAIFAPDLTKRDWTELLVKVYYSRSLYKISIVDLDKNPIELKKRILTTGILIYEK